MTTPNPGDAQPGDDATPTPAQYPGSEAASPPPPPALPPGPPEFWAPSRSRGCLYSVIGTFVLVALIVAIVVVALIKSVKTTPGSGTSRHPAAADISITSCTVDPSVKVPVAKGTVHNHSSQKSDYTFSISFLNPAGTVVGQAGAVENGVAAAQSAMFTVHGGTEVATVASCRVANVTRFASP